MTTPRVLSCAQPVPKPMLARRQHGHETAIFGMITAGRSLWQSAFSLQKALLAQHGTALAYYFYRKLAGDHAKTGHASATAAHGEGTRSHDNLKIYMSQYCQTACRVVNLGHRFRLAFTVSVLRYLTWTLEWQTSRCLCSRLFVALRLL